MNGAKESLEAPVASGHAGSSTGAANLEKCTSGCVCSKDTSCRISRGRCLKRGKQRDIVEGLEGGVIMATIEIRVENFTNVSTDNRNLQIAPTQLARSVASP